MENLDDQDVALQANYHQIPQFMNQRSSMQSYSIDQQLQKQQQQQEEDFSQVQLVCADSESKEECLICYESLKQEVSCEVCKKRFCEGCARKWRDLKNQCPLKCHGAPWRTSLGDIVAVREQQVQFEYLNFDLEDPYLNNFHGQLIRLMDLRNVLQSISEMENDLEMHHLEIQQPLQENQNLPINHLNFQDQDQTQINIEYHEGSEYTINNDSMDEGEHEENEILQEGGRSQPLQAQNQNNHQAYNNQQLYFQHNQLQMHRVEQLDDGNEQEIESIDSHSLKSFDSHRIQSINDSTVFQNRQPMREYQENQEKTQINLNYSILIQQEINEEIHPEIEDEGTITGQVPQLIFPAKPINILNNNTLNQTNSIFHNPNPKNDNSIFQEPGIQNIPQFLALQKKNYFKNI